MRKDYNRNKNIAQFIVDRSISYSFVLVTELCSIAIKSDIPESVRS